MSARIRKNFRKFARRKPAGVFRKLKVSAGYVKSNRPELKHKEFSWSAIGCYGTNFGVNVQPIVTGTASGERIGNRVAARSMHMRLVLLPPFTTGLIGANSNAPAVTPRAAADVANGTIMPTSDTVGGIVRVLVVRSKVKWTANTDFVSAINAPANFDRCKVLFDKMYHVGWSSAACLSQANTDPCWASCGVMKPVVIDKKFRLRKKNVIVYDGTGSADVAQNGIYICIIGDRALEGGVTTASKYVNCSGFTTLYYTDA